MVSYEVLWNLRVKSILMAASIYPWVTEILCLILFWCRTDAENTVKGELFKAVFLN